MAELPKRRFVKSRVTRATAVLLLLAFSAALLMWQLWRPCDPHLVGTWVVVPEPLSNWNEAWQFRANGTGERDLRRTRSGVNSTTVKIIAERFRWWTDGDRLYITWGTDAIGWERIAETAQEFVRTVEGQPERFSMKEYGFVIENETLISVEPQQPKTADYDTLLFWQPTSIEFGLN